MSTSMDPFDGSVSPEHAVEPRHRPVLLSEALDLLGVRPGGSGTYVDATFGGGGHTRAILAAGDPGSRVLALDADPAAVRRAEELERSFGERLTVRHGNFADLGPIAREAGFSSVDGILMDLGLSSFQLDTAARGFSFRLPAPLDMRFDPTTGPSAADIVNQWDEPDLVRILFQYGEEPKARRIARAIVAARAEAPIRTTDELAALVERAVGGRRGRAIHPATKTFQALRIAVNRELEVLERGLSAALDLLAPGGRIVVISFHSLEDRIVKQLFRTEARDCICPPQTPVCVCNHRARLRILTARPIQPAEIEQETNPRSRSAKLRAAERLP